MTPPHVIPALSRPVLFASLTSLAAFIDCHSAPCGEQSVQRDTIMKRPHITPPLPGVPIPLDSTLVRYPITDEARVLVSFPGLCYAIDCRAAIRVALEQHQPCHHDAARI